MQESCSPGPEENVGAVEMGHIPFDIPSKAEPLTWEGHSPAPLALGEGWELLSNPSEQAERGVPCPVCVLASPFPGSRARSRDQSSHLDAAARRKEGKQFHQDRGAAAALGKSSPRLEQDLD